MGATASRTVKSKLECQYKLVRRFVSDLYGSSQVTVIEHKQTQQSHILKQFVQQFNAEKLLAELESHQSLSHKNLIQLQRYWLENDLNICSSLFKVYTVFQFFQETLEDLLEDQRTGNRGIGDRDIADFVRQISSALSFLQRNRVPYLLLGPRSIAVTEQTEEVPIKKTKKAIQQLSSHRRSISKLFQEDNEQRQSLVCFGRTSAFTDSRQQSDSRASFQKDNSQNPLRTKRVYKIFDPIEGFCANRSLSHLQTSLQVPLHPNLSSSSDHYLLSDAAIKEQNQLTVGLIALSMCEEIDIMDLDLFKNGRFSLDKYNKRIQLLKKSHHRTAKELQKMMGNPFHNFQHSVRLSQGIKIKDIALFPKRKLSQLSLMNDDKQNTGLMKEKEHQSKSDKKFVTGLMGRASSKRASLWQI